jgi:hypothetical protein
MVMMMNGGGTGADIQTNNHPGQFITGSNSDNYDDQFYASSGLTSGGSF